MKTPALAAALATAFSVAAFAAPQSTSKSGRYQGFPKNIARQHYGTTLQVFSATTNRYTSTEAAAAWLDDDIATGWAALAGKQHYLLQFAEPQLVTNFQLSTKNTAGTVTIYTGDQEAAPTDKAWTLVAKDIPLEAINHQKLARPINKYAKCLLIETNIPDSGSIYSVNVFGERSAASTSIVNRVQAVDVKSILGDFVNNQTAFNMAGIYANGTVTFANAGGADASWQRAIDDDPESFVSIKASSSESGMVVRFGESRPLSRLSLLTNPKSRGKLDVFLLSEAPQSGVPVSLEGISPSVSLAFDGTSPRGSADFAETRAAAMAVRWTPDSGETPFAIREVNIFADLNLTDHEVAGAPVAIAKGPSGADDVSDSESTTSVADGKSIADGKSLADGKSPIALGPGGKSAKDVSQPPAVTSGPGGFLPGSLGFPPVLPVFSPPPTPISN